MLRMRRFVSFAFVMAFVAACASPSAPSARSVSPARHADVTATDEGPSEEAEANDDAEEEEAPETIAGPCPKNMVLVATPESQPPRFCVDTYEASLVEIGDDGTEKPYPHWLPVDGHRVRAVSEAGVFPQGFISEVQAEDACAASGKRLCTHVEWKTACMGPAKTTFPYGNTRRPGVCHDTGKSAVAAVFGAKALGDPIVKRPVSTTKGRAAQTKVAKKPPLVTKKTAAKKKPIQRHARASARPASVEPSVWTQLNDPRLGQVEGALSKTGSHDACVNGFGVVDMVGNLHEWVKTGPSPGASSSDPASSRGTFAGGYYLDTALNGDGCLYRTTAHAHDYHDYSTGFRCCAEPR